jgi:hypothetical protein
MFLGCQPKITRFTPEQGPVGIPVKIEGERFKDSPSRNTVKFGGVAVPTAEILSSAENLLEAKVPIGAQTGLITVETSEGKAESDKNFVVTTSSPQAKWTLMIYLDADNNLEMAGIDDFLEMATVGSNPQINIVLQMDRWMGYGGYGSWTGTRRFLVKKNDTPSVAPLQDLGEKNMGDPITLQNFVEWAVTSFPAEKYALVIWNHGDGWRLMREQMAMKSRKASTEVSPDTAAAYKAVSQDVTNNDILYMKEVQIALESAKNRLMDRLATNLKLDIVAFDACLMGMVEVAYALRNVANYIVGSEQTEPGDGWPYDRILTELAANPSMTARDLASLIVTKYGEQYGSSGLTTQSALDISNLNNLALRIDAFTAAANTDWNNIKTARANSLRFNAGCPPEVCWGIDLWNFSDEVYNRVSSPAIKIAAQAVKDAVQQIVVREYHSSLMPKARGVAIYFPQTLSDFNNDPDHGGYLQSNIFMPVDFVLIHFWDNWIQQYYANTP